MSLYTNYDQMMFRLVNHIEVVKQHDSPGFPGNSLATCVAQVLLWFQEKNDTAPSGDGEKTPLYSRSERAKELQFGTLENGSVLPTIADSVVNLVGQNSAKKLETLTPWSGKFKLYLIASSKGHGHALGVYFPWLEPVEFYDPNLLVGKMKSTQSAYEVLSEWPRIYNGCPKVSVTWGHEGLFVFSDPDEALKKLKR